MRYGLIEITDWIFFIFWTKRKYESLEGSLLKKKKELSRYNELINS